MSAGMHLSFGSIVLVAFWAVLVAELVGDKSIYVVASLGLRFRPLLVFAAAIAAFATKTLAAVLFARLLVQFHSRWLDALSAAAFFFSALWIWFDEPAAATPNIRQNASWWRAAGVCFTALFLTEWGDPGQVALAAITLKSHSVLASWLGGTLAMATKGALSLWFGVGLRERLPLAALRALASASCCVMGITALGGALFR